MRYNLFILILLILSSCSKEDKYDVIGVIHKVHHHNNELTIHHDEIPGFMSKMTMNFKIDDGVDLNQFKTESIDEIYASHVLEHVGRFKVTSTLQGIYRVLKKKGKFYVSVPDMDILCHAFVNPKGTAQMKFHFMRMIFGGQVDDNDFHYFERHSFYP